MNKIKNSKKGFTLVELVVVIAILAILAAIAIPVVASTIKSSQVSSAQSNAQTIELAIKEAQAAVSAGDNSVFANASANKVTVSDVATAKKIGNAMDKTYTIDGATYKCVWADSKVYYAVDVASGSATIDGTTTLPAAGTALTSGSTANVTSLT